MQDDNISGQGFSQEQLDSLLGGSSAEPIDPYTTVPSNKRVYDRPIFDLTDTVYAVPRGVVGFAKSAYNLVDAVDNKTVDWMPTWETNPLGTSRSTVGGFVEGISQVVTGFSALTGALGVVSKAPGAIGSAASWLASGGEAAGLGSTLARGVIKGAAVDFVSFEANAGRLSDVLTESDNPILNNAVTQYLKSDINDGEFVGRLKTALEGAGIGAALESTIYGIKGSVKAIREYRLKLAEGATREEAVRAAAEVAANDLEHAERLGSEVSEESKATAEASSEAAAQTSAGEEPTANAPAGEQPAEANNNGSQPTAVTPTEGSAAPAQEGTQASSQSGPNGGPNFGVDAARSTKSGLSRPDVIKRIVDMVKTGAGTQDIANELLRLHNEGIINLTPGGAPNTPSVYAEVAAAAQQVNENPEAFGRRTPGTNAEKATQAAAFLKSAEETGGLNVAEINKLLADGVLTTDQLVRMMPIYQGIEMAQRQQLVQAMRQGRADLAQLAQAYTSVMGATARIRSNVGKALQAIQAIPSMDSIMEHFAKLSPAQQRVAMNQMGEILQDLVVNPEVGMYTARRFIESNAIKGFRMAAEVYRNSILSGAKTVAKFVWGGVQAMSAPLERAVGNALIGNPEQANHDLLTFCRYFSEAKDTFNILWSSLKEEGDSIITGRGNMAFGEYQPRRTIASNSFLSLQSVDPVTGGTTRTALGAVVDFVGQVVNIPLRAHGSINEVLSTITARAEADVVLRKIISERSGLPLSSSIVSSEVERLKEKLFVDGQLYTRRTVIERAGKIARDKYLPGALRDTIEDGIVTPLVNEHVSTLASKPSTEELAKIREQITASPDVQNQISSLYDQAVSNGRLRSISDISASPDKQRLLQFISAAGERAKSHPLFLSEIQRYVDQNWDAYVDEEFMGVGGQHAQAGGADYKILQQASKEIEQRIRNQTWRRDLDEMSKSDVWGTKVVGSVSKGVNSMVQACPPLQLVVPFNQTPTNLLAWVSDRNPLGRSLAWYQAAKAGDREAAAEAAGRLCTGGLLFTTGAVCAANGAITGKGPDDPSLRKQLLASGWQPYSFKFTNPINGKVTYVSYNRSDPTGTFFGLVADAYEIAANTYNPSPEQVAGLQNATTAVLLSISNNVTDKSYLRGVVTVLGAMMGKQGEADKVIRQYAGAAVPNFLAQTETSAIDDDVREARSALDAVKARLPYFSGNVDKYRDVLGDPIKGSESAWSMFLPTSGTERVDDPVKRELADSLVKVDAPRSTLPGGIDLRAVKLQSGQSAYDRLQELTGQTRLGGRTLRDQLQAVISSPFYKQMPAMGVDSFDSPRVALVRGHVNHYRHAAMQQLIRESPELAQQIAAARQLKSSLYR